MLESLVRQFLYYPTRLSEQEPVPGYAGSCVEIWADADDGNRIHGLHWAAPEGRPTILFLHGNAQSVYEWALIHQELAPLECGLLLIDYPGYGKSTGKPSEAGLYAAGHAALTWLEKEAGVAMGSTIVFGKSLGGGVASEIVAGQELLGLILESTFRSIPDVTRRLLPMVPVGAVLDSERYDTASKMADIDIPVLVVHGVRDELIPVGEGEALFELANDPKELYLVDNAGHNDVSYMAGPAYGKRLREWLDGLER